MEVVTVVVVAVVVVVVCVVVVCVIVVCVVVVLVTVVCVTVVGLGVVGLGGAGAGVLGVVACADATSAHAHADNATSSAAANVQLRVLRAIMVGSMPILLRLLSGPCVLRHGRRGQTAHHARQQAVSDTSNTKKINNAAARTHTRDTAPQAWATKLVDVAAGPGVAVGGGWLAAHGGVHGRPGGRHTRHRRAADASDARRRGGCRKPRRENNPIQPPPCANPRTRAPAALGGVCKRTGRGGAQHPAPRGEASPPREHAPTPRRGTRPSRQELWTVRHGGDTHLVQTSPRGRCQRRNLVPRRSGKGLPPHAPVCTAGGVRARECASSWKFPTSHWAEFCMAPLFRDLN